MEDEALYRYCMASVIVRRVLWGNYCMVLALGGVWLWNLPHLIADIDYYRRNKKIFTFDYGAFLR
jgi:hypothetical protein